MAKTTNTYTSTFKLFGIPLFELKQTFFELSTTDESPSVSDDVILYERIARLKEKEKKWFK